MLFSCYVKDIKESNEADVFVEIHSKASQRVLLTASSRNYGWAEDQVRHRETWCLGKENKKITAIAKHNLWNVKKQENTDKAKYLEAKRKIWKGFIWPNVNQRENDLQMLV